MSRAATAFLSGIRAMREEQKVPFENRFGRRNGDERFLGIAISSASDRANDNLCFIFIFGSSRRSALERRYA